MTDQPLALTVEQGLHAEQDLLAAVCRGETESGVLFWRPTDHALVMPRRMSRLDNFEAACSELAIAGWPVLLRETGGEPVPQSHSTVNVALVYVAPRSEGDHGRIENAYERLCLPLCDVLREWGGVASVGEIDGAFCDGRYNVNLNGRKLVGTAQRWRQGLGGKRPVVLVHGALLLDNERESMVAAVNRFNECCGLEQRCRADSHIALHEVAPAVPWFERLSKAYSEVLAALPKD
ncbi:MULTISPECIES: biotin/lipoate A/B protein ligase family protein [Pseudomonas]|uniref:Lipoate--protein ligase family protein n=1 Tax=Pseudomonas putida TaxID=303 RepID=A0A7Y7ZCI1_PSEPU|nr:MULTISPECIES: lipoate--protein ligase family protein [Pseudomonas]KAF1309932.1 lipoate--protein ligase [Pseudomonas sp. SG-MS2]MBG6125933.1 lipoate-protein ligase A [Pseudomonas sp. M2]NSX23041.1 lipoate--protein ligase family protein [Pseudomonas putida]NWC82441.1 lipoate--protein ligase family protein [Pseudomonas putida]RRV43740.1 lipoate--protein ligase family protein [Pseudomonas sp. p106]